MAKKDTVQKRLDEALDEVQEVNGINEHLRNDRATLRRHITRLQSQLKETLHNKAELEWRLRCSLSELEWPENTTNDAP